MGALGRRAGMRSQAFLLAVLTAGCCLVGALPAPKQESVTVEKLTESFERALRRRSKDSTVQLRRRQSKDAPIEPGTDYALAFDYEMYQSIVDFLPRIIGAMKAVGGELNLPIVDKIATAIEAATKVLQQEEENKKGGENVEENVEPVGEKKEENVEKEENVKEGDKVEEGENIENEENVEEGENVVEEIVEEVENAGEGENVEEGEKAEENVEDGKKVVEEKVEEEKVEEEKVEEVKNSRRNRRNRR